MLCDVLDHERQISLCVLSEFAIGPTLIFRGECRGNGNGHGVVGMENVMTGNVNYQRAFWQISSPHERVLVCA